PDITNWCIGTPSQVQVTKSAPSVSNITRTVAYTPDYVKCRQTAQVVEPSSASYKVTTALGYDNFGNVNNVSVTGVGMTARTTTVDWGTRGQFPVTITNALSQPTIRDYNYDLGVLKSETNPNGLQSSWQTDGFGRRSLETRPDG